MKKNFLFKGVSVLGAILLLANVALPGMVTYAEQITSGDESNSESNSNNSGSGSENAGGGESEEGTSSDNSTEAAQITPITISTEGNSNFTEGEIYEFTSYSSDGKTEYATGKAQVVAQGTVVEVESNYKVEGANDEGSFVDKQFAIKATSDSVEDKGYQLFPVGENNMTLSNNVYVKIGEKSTNDNSIYYDFTSYAEEGATTKWGDGKVKVINGFTTVTVTENYAKESSWVGQQFTIDESARDGDKTKLHKITPINVSSSDSSLYVQIVNKKEGEGENAKTTYDYVSYNCTSSEENTTPSAESCTKWGYGTVEVVTDTQNEETTSTDTTTPTTTVKVIENYAKTNAFVDDKYTVNETLRDGDVEAYHKLLPAVSLENNNSSNTANLSDELYVQIVKENEVEGENGKTTYDYISYIKNGETYTKRGYGTVELEEQGTIVEVVENYRLDNSFVGQKFYVYGLENNNSFYQLHSTTATNDSSIYVKVKANGEKYDFVSFADNQGTTKLGDGTVKVLNQFTVVKVLENSVESFKDQYFIVYDTEISSNKSLIPLYNTNGQSANISIKLSSFTVSFNSNGGSEVKSQNVNPGEKVSKPSNPSKSGYTFKGRYSDEALTNEWNFDSNTVTKNITLYAKWEQNKSSSSSSSRSGGGGGSSKSTTKTTTTTTGDTKTTTDTKATDTKTTTTVNTNDNTKTPAYNDKYSKEFNDAYQFAYKNGITTMPSIEEADMEGTLTRIAMAKMLSQYAINVLGKTPDTTKVVPTFPDVTAQMDADYNNGVTLAYQLGIMGIGIDKFRPDDLVTRAEFATALSRLLFNTPDGEGAYYETHLAKLMEEKIITNNNPDLQELRGYVMIMLMRSAQS